MQLETLISFKKIALCPKSSIVLALAITLCLSIAVMASTATLGGTINFDPITDLVWDQEDPNHEVTGYVAFDSSNDVPKLETLELEVQKVGSKGWTTIDSQNYTESPKDSVGLPDYSDTQGYEFNFKDWTIEAEGTYKLRVTATFTDSFAKAKATITVAVTPDTDEDSEEEDLDKNKVKNEDEDEDADTLNEDDGNCPAAPAVAGKLLKEHKVKNHYEGGNYIADVAKKMGPNGEFRDVQKCDIDEYQKEIEDFLDEQGAFDEEITKEIANETQQNQSDKKPKHNQK